MKRYQVILIVVFLMGSTTLLSQMDYQDQQQAAARYCEMTKSGAWGEYKEGVECE